MKKIIAIIAILISAYKPKMHGVVYTADHHDDWTGSFTVIVDGGTIAVPWDPEDLDVGDEVTIYCDIFGKIERVVYTWR